ncbi:hypothetical protein BpHYR1_047964, partial [Brachionus plicatilis]
IYRVIIDLVIRGYYINNKENYFKPGQIIKKITKIGKRKQIIILNPNGEFIYLFINKSFFNILNIYLFIYYFKIHHQSIKKIKFFWACNVTKGVINCNLSAPTFDDWQNNLQRFQNNEKNDSKYILYIENTTTIKEDRSNQIFIKFMKTRAQHELIAKEIHDYLSKRPNESQQKFRTSSMLAEKKTLRRSELNK